MGINRAMISLVRILLLLAVVVPVHFVVMSRMRQASEASGSMADMLREAIDGNAPPVTGGTALDALPSVKGVKTQFSKNVLKVGFASVNPANPKVHFDLPMPSADEVPVSFAELIAFVNGSRCHLRRYVIDIHDCKHFSHELLLEARAAGIPSRMILISLVGEKVGHAITGFLTADRGIVYVDFTPATDPDGSSQQAQKNLVFLGEGKAYRRVPVGDTSPSFGNTESEFIEKEKVRESMLAMIAGFETKLTELDAGINSLEGRRAKVEALPRTPSSFKIIAGFNNEVDILIRERDRLRGEHSRIRKEIAAGEARGWNYARCDWVTEKFVVLPSPFPEFNARTMEVSGSHQAMEAEPSSRQNSSLPPGMSIRRE